MMDQRFSAYNNFTFLMNVEVEGCVLYILSMSFGMLRGINDLNQI